MSFAVPLFLLAALAGAIPILLHMINRQQAPIVPFATLRFLRLAVERTRKRKYLHDVLLLTLRVLALVVIAIALARPMLAQLRHLFGASTASVVLIVDNSASLATKDQAGRRWDAAVHAAEQALDQLRDGDTAALILTCGPRRPETERLLSNHEVLRQALAAAHPSLQRADLTARLHEARELLAKSPSPNKEIYIVTDMQAASWEGLTADADQATRSQPPVVVIDVHGASLPNVGLRGAAVQAAAPVVGVPMQAKVTVVGDPLVRQQTHVELLLDGRSRQISPTLTLEPGAAVDYVFPLTIDQPGVHRGEMRIVGEDACPADDRAYFAVTVDPNIPVAIVKGRQHEVSYLDDSFYLERALSPIAGGEWAIKATPLTASALAAEPLSTYAVIFCVNVPPLEAPSAQRLAQYVQAGGRVVWIGGENCDMAGYNGMNELTGSKLLPAPLAGVRERSPERPDGWRIGSLDDRHPALDVFASPPSLIQSVLVTKHVRLKTSGVTDLRVLARLDDGEPLMVQR
ncbi:MAG TPA: BatA domain-containing protein, partial [Pirellulaceae bacterium]|nr:BatA domain-containing protein [Pirellulaceae bacterium]